MIKEVYLIFKTHLDIGFTNSASTVVKRYLEEFIPNAIKIPIPPLYGQQVHGSLTKL